MLYSESVKRRTLNHVSAVPAIFPSGIEENQVKSSQEFKLQELKLQGIKICVGVVFSRYTEKIATGKNPIGLRFLAAMLI